MALTFRSRVRCRLTEDVTATRTTLPVGPGGNNFLPLDGGSVLAVLRDVEGEEVVRVTAAAFGLLTVIRGQEGTTPRAFRAGSLVSLRLTSGGLAGHLQKGVMRQISYNPNATLSPAHFGEQVAETGVDGCVRRIWQNVVDGVMSWRIVYGDMCRDLTNYRDWDWYLLDYDWDWWAWTWTEKPQSEDPNFGYTLVPGGVDINFGNDTSELDFVPSGPLYSINYEIIEGSSGRVCLHPLNDVVVDEYGVSHSSSLYAISGSFTIPQISQITIGFTAKNNPPGATHSPNWGFTVMVQDEYADNYFLLHLNSTSPEPSTYTVMMKSYKTDESGGNSDINIYTNSAAVANEFSHYAFTLNNSGAGTLEIDGSTVGTYEFDPATFPQLTSSRVSVTGAAIYIDNVYPIYVDSGYVRWA